MLLCVLYPPDMCSYVRDVVLYGGRPWGFTLCGGREESRELYVAAVSIRDKNSMRFPAFLLGYRLFLRYT